MHHHYEDIRSRIAEEPRWFDENGVPRYSDFGPDQVADIYADEVALVEIACQGCGILFPVAFSRSRLDMVRTGQYRPLADEIQDGSIHYGDPPNVGCCPSGPTMNCLDRRVIEYHRRTKTGFGWERVTELEITLPVPPAV